MTHFAAGTFSIRQDAAAAVLRAARASGVVCELYTALARHYDLHPQPGTGAVGEKLGISKSSTSRAVATLRSLGLITIEGGRWKLSRLPDLNLATSSRAQIADYGARHLAAQSCQIRQPEVVNLGNLKLSDQATRVVRSGNSELSDQATQVVNLGNSELSDQATRTSIKKPKKDLKGDAGAGERARQSPPPPAAPLFYDPDFEIRRLIVARYTDRRGHGPRSINWREFDTNRRSVLATDDTTDADIYRGFELWIAAEAKRGDAAKRGLPVHWFARDLVQWTDAARAERIAAEKRARILDGICVPTMLPEGFNEW